MTWAGAARLKKRVGDSNQRELARALNLSPSALNNYLSGRRSPDPDTLARICRTLEVSADWMLGLVSDPAQTFVAKPVDPETDPNEAGIVRKRILGMLAKLEKGDLTKNDREMLEDLAGRVDALERGRAKTG
ncbi:MAG: helix-turn-helix transcriptional regulator [Thermoanaerobaculia bacterium]